METSHILKTPLESIYAERVNFFRTLSELEILPSASFLDLPHRQLYASGLDYAPCNGIFEKPQAPTLRMRDLEEAIAYFEDKKLPFVWWTDNPILEKKEFVFGGVMKGVAIDLADELPFALPIQGITLKIVKTEEELRQFCRTCCICFPMDEQCSSQISVLNAEIWKRGEYVYFLAEKDGQPISCVTLSISPGSCGIWNFGTLPEYRKKGIGSALTLFALKEAQERGFSHCMAILMPKGLAWGSFQMLGFREYCNFPFYIYGGGSKPLEA